MIYVLLGLCVAFLVVITILVLVLRAEITHGRSMLAVAQVAGEQLLKATLNQIEAQVQRDAAIVRATAAQAAADRGIAQLAATQEQRNIAVAKLADRLKTDIIGMSDADAIAAINAELGL